MNKAPNPETARQETERFVFPKDKPPDYPMEHNVMLMHAVLTEHDEAVRAYELAQQRKVLRAPKALRGIVGAPRTIVSTGLERVAYRAHDVGTGTAGAVDRAEEALRHEKALTRTQRVLEKAGGQIGLFWESGGEYLNDRADRIAQGIDNARTAVRNKPALLTFSKAAHWVGDRLNRLQESLDRSRIA